MQPSQVVPVALPVTAAAHLQMMLSLGSTGNVSIVFHVFKGEIRVVGVDGMEHWRQTPGDKPWELVVG